MPSGPGQIPITRESFKEILAILEKKYHESYSAKLLINSVLPYQKWKFVPMTPDSFSTAKVKTTDIIVL